MSDEPSRRPTPSPEIDAVLAALPDRARGPLQHLREVIGAAAPGAVEAIAYGVPAFKYRRRPLVSFGAGKSGEGHLAFYVQSPEVMEAFAEELRSFDTSKGTVRFSPVEPIPDDLVTRLVQARIAEIDRR